MTCTPSRGRRTRTSGRCLRCGRTAAAPPRGWAAALAAGRDTVRRYAPRIAAAGDDAELARDEAARSARMPGLALRAARDALASGPVLFQVPRRGYVVAVACEACGARPRCPRCGGPLSLPAAGAAAVCGWCGQTAGSRCPN